MMKWVNKLSISVLSMFMFFSASVAVEANVENSNTNFSEESEIYFYEGATFENLEGEMLVYNNGFLLNKVTGKATPLAVDPISILVGVVIAWIVDGILIKATGYTGAEWAAYGINAIADYTAGFWLGAEKYFMDQNTKEVSYVMNSQGCVLANPQGTLYYCPTSVDI